ncbi:MAG: GAF domain-containing protein [Chloroflexota bacterium]
MSQFSPTSEAQRLTELEQYHILDTSPESAFDDLVNLAIHICDMPIALISFIDTNRQWIKSKAGIDETAFSREESFCTHTITIADGLIVPDAIQDNTFATILTVTESPHIRFYAGVPLITPQGAAIGTLSVMDHKPRELSSASFAALHTLAQQVVAQLELRRYTAKLPSTTQQALHIANSDDIRFHEIAKYLRDVFWITDPTTEHIMYISPAYEEIWGRPCEALYNGDISFIDTIHPEDRAQALQALSEQVQGTVEEEYRIVRPDGSIRWIEDRAVPVYDEHNQVRYVIGIAMDITNRKRNAETLLSRESILQAVGLTGELLLGDKPLEQSIPEMLRQLGGATQVSRIYIFENHHMSNGLAMSQRYEWVMPGIKPEIDNPELQELSYEDAGFTRWPEALRERKIVVGNVRDFPTTERAILEPQDILSIVIVPIFVGSEWWGFIGFDECTQERMWHDSELEALKMAANLLGAALQQQDGETERIALQQQVIDAQQAAIRELSTPLIPLTDQVILMPLIGAIDQVRAQFILETLLTGVAEHQAELVILDITGVELVDTYIANTIVQAAQAVKLLGAQVMMTGIQPQIAQTLVQLGVDLNNIVTRGTLQDGIAFALANINLNTNTAQRTSKVSRQPFI